MTMNTILGILFLLIVGIVLWALFGKGEGRESRTQAEEETPDRLYRRRAADKDIEKEFPDTEEFNYKRKSDFETDEKTGDVDEEFDLPYLVDEIISDSSRFRVFKRTILNSELYARKGNFTTAISLYEGVNKRINDENVNFKINANIDYLKKYQKSFSEKKREKIRKHSKDQGASEVKVSLEGPLSIPEKIQIGLAVPGQELQAPKIDIDKIADEIVGKLVEKKIINDEDAKVIEGYQTEINKLQSSVEELIEFKENTEKPAEETEQDEDDKEIVILQDGIKNINEKIELLSREDQKTRVELDEIKSINEDLERELEAVQKEVDDEPVLTEAKYQAPAPAVHESKPTVEAIPEEKAPEPKAVKSPEKDKDEPEEIELLSEYGREEDEMGRDELSDEDIFEKILSSDEKKKKENSIEILGTKDNGDDLSHEIVDEEIDRRQKEEEKFYKKFLQHDKRKRKELPILKVSYDFTKLPDDFSLSRDKNILEYSFYKYKSMLEQANEFIKTRNVKDAINYYKVVLSQNIPFEFKAMLRKNINELTEYIEKYLASD